MLQPWLDRQGAAVYLAVANQGDRPSDAKTNTNPEALTAAMGKWAARLHGAGLSCKVLDAEEFKKPMHAGEIGLDHYVRLCCMVSACRGACKTSWCQEEVVDLINMRS